MPASVFGFGARRSIEHRMATEDKGRARWQLDREQRHEAIRSPLVRQSSFGSVGGLGGTPPLIPNRLSLRGKMGWAGK